MYNFYMNGMLDYDDDINILSSNNIYSRSEQHPINFSYSFSDYRLKELRELYSLDSIAGNGNDFTKMLKITFWLASVLKFGNATETNSFHALEILYKTQHNGFTSNCFIAATVLTECFLSMGVTARMIRCLPIDLRYDECHCMVMAFIKEYNKFIAFDAAMGGCYFNNHGIPLGIPDIRDSLISNDSILLRGIFSTDFTKNITHYLAKNMVRFQCHLETRYGNEIKNTHDTVINLNPTTIRLKDKKVWLNNAWVQHVFVYNDRFFWNM